MRGDTTKDIHVQLESILKAQPPCLEEDGAKRLSLSILYSCNRDLLEKVAKARDLICQGAEIDDSEGIFFTPNPWGSSRAAFLFPGQGIQIHGVLSSFQDGLPGFRDEIEHIHSLWLTLDGRDLLGVMCEGDPHSNERTLRETQNAQPAIGMVSDAIASALSKLNVQPRFYAGHSFGELSALRAAGALQRETFLRMSRMRGYLLAEAGGRNPGAMTSIMTTLDKVKELLAQVDGTIAVACLNAPEQTVVAGERTAILQMEKICREQGIRNARLRTPCAFHSPLMSPVTEDWKGCLEEMITGDQGYRAPPEDMVFSNVTAQTYPADKRVMTNLLCRQLVSPVRWEEICRVLYERGVRIFIEVGTGAVLTGLLAKSLAGKPHLGLTFDGWRGDTSSAFLILLAKLASHGIPVKWQPFYQECTRPRLSVRGEPNSGGYPKMERIEYGRNNGHANETSDQHASAFKAFLDSNRRVLESFFEAQDRILEKACDGVTGESRVELLRRLMQGNQTVMDQFMSLQQEAGRFAAGQPFPCEPSVLSIPSAITGRRSERERPFSEALPELEEPEVDAREEASPLRPKSDDACLQLEDWLRQEIADVTGLPPETLDADTRFDRDLALDSITTLQIFVRMMDVFPETRKLETELHGVRSIEMLQDLVRDAGTVEADGTEGAADSKQQGSPTRDAEQETSSQNIEKSEGSSERGDLGSPAAPDSRVRPWGEVKGWLAQRLAASSGINADEITESTDFFDDLSLDPFVHEEIVEELVALVPEIGVAGYALQNARNIRELRNLMVAVSVEDESKDPTQYAEKPAENPDPVERFVLTETPCEIQVQDPPAMMPSRMILAGCEGAVFEHYRKGLQDCGIEVTPLRLAKGRWEISLTDKPETIQLDDVTGLGNALGIYCEGNRIPDLLFLAMGDGSASPGRGTSKWIEELEYATSGLFSIAIALLDQKDESELTGELFAVIGSENASPGWRAAAGLTRSIRREWPNVNVSYSLLDCRPADLPVDRLLVSLLRKGRDDELVFGPAGTRCIRLLRRPLDRIATASRHVDVGSDSLLLLTGGGAGITAALGCMLAEKYQCRIAAIGRTPWPGEERFADITDGAELKRHIYRELVQEEGRGKTLMRQTAEVIRARFQEIERQRSLLNTAARIKTVGGEFSYYQADCSNKEDLIRIIESIHKEAGPIHGLIHGAGITADSRLAEKTLDSFRRVVHTKARSSFQLYSLLKDDPLEFVVFLSSLSSYAGRAGQTDYAAANEALNALAHVWNRQAPYPVKSLLWSVWTETGLVVEGMKREMERLGLGGISTADGIRLSHEEIFGAPKVEDWVLFTPISTLKHATRHTVQPFYHYEHGAFQSR